MYNVMQSHTEDILNNIHNCILSLVIACYYFTAYTSYAIYTPMHTCPSQKVDVSLPTPVQDKEKDKTKVDSAE